MMITFKKAEKSQSKLRLAIYGPSGSGKTFSSLLIAKGLSGSIALIDTERGSASKYADIANFDVLELSNRSIDDYIAGITAAGQAGYSVLIIDSMSHAWQELVEEIDKLAENPRFKGNTFRAWAQGTPKQKKFVDSLLRFPGHLIGTMRSSTEWAVEVGSNGKPMPRKLGLKPEQGKGIESEIDLLMSITPEHWATIEKDRTGKYQDKQIEKPGIDFGMELSAWLCTGTAHEPLKPVKTPEIKKTVKPPVNTPAPEKLPPSAPPKAGLHELSKILRYNGYNDKEAMLNAINEIEGFNITSSDDLTEEQIAMLTEHFLKEVR